MRNFSSVGLKWCLVVALALPGIMPASYAASTSGGDKVEFSCGAPPPGHPVKGRRDYRLMSTNVKDQRDLRYHEYFHIDPARKAISRGKLDWDVMNNLHFVLHKVPNDERALGLLMQWDKAGGRDKRYASPACYVVWAREFVPDDPKVLMYGGYYFYQHKDLDRARQWWEDALVQDPKNADVHYNLGLLLFEQGRYAEARAHARTAYEAGYPLPGLRNKLQAAGQWHDALQTTR
jgi:tetratricopeptide (TPR) repeat protein